MVQKIIPSNIIAICRVTARQQKERNNYFTIPKAFVDSSLIEIGKEYEIAIIKIEK